MEQKAPASPPWKQMPEVMLPNRKGKQVESPAADPSQLEK
jgi:hypothetical protein